MTGKFGLIPFEEAAKHYDISDMGNGFFQLRRRSDTPPILNVKVYQEKAAYSPDDVSRAVLQGVILKILSTEKIKDF